MPKAYKKRKKYRVSGGNINGKKEVTCEDISTYGNIPFTTVYSRLRAGVTDVAELTKLVNKKKARPKKKKEVINKLLFNKPFYDEMFRLAMRKI